MRLPKVTEIFRFCLTRGPACAAATGMALIVAGAPASAARPAGDADWQVAIVPEQATVNTDGPLVPPAPEPAEEIALQVEPAAAAADPPAPAEYFEAPSHGIAIIPAESAKPVEVNGRTYEDVYRSIPFNHTEYMANPSYRHEATMEILFGQLRPMTIVKDQQAQPIVNQLPSPYQPYRYSLSERWQYHAPAFRLLDPGCCQ
jgi:hypothetical protein